VAAGAGGNRNHAVDSQLGAFSRMPVGGDIVENEASVIVDRLDDCRARGERKHDDGNLSRDDDLEIGVEPRIALVGDQIDRKRNVAAFQGALDHSDLLVEQPGRPRIERRHGPDDAAPALRDDESGRRGNEHRAGHDGDAKLRLQELCQRLVASHGSAPNAIRP